MKDSRKSDRAHLQDIEPGAGCVEIWEKLSERRNAAEADEETDEELVAEARKP
ncbi:hypothetical protein [Haladaptatus sp. DYSN1]|uniref:hypothetical protein n=1 Tax=unclassified Haladaptatus TaxID=2622732 RepID=UPI002405F0C5|nr:hypothetical protein [Haladaptatus sp. DYSN1]